MRGQFSQCERFITPLMMEQQWKSECQLLLHPETVIDNHESITLSRPASRCPHCGHSIRWFENMPVISWLLLKGNVVSVATPLVIVIRL